MLVNVALDMVITPPYCGSPVGVGVGVGISVEVEVEVGVGIGVGVGVGVGVGATAQEASTRDRIIKQVTVSHTILLHIYLFPSVL